MCNEFYPNLFVEKSYFMFRKSWVRTYRLARFVAGSEILTGVFVAALRMTLKSALAIDGLLVADCGRPLSRSCCRYRITLRKKHFACVLRRLQYLLSASIAVLGMPRTRHILFARFIRPLSAQPRGLAARKRPPTSLIATTSVSNWGL